MDGYHRPIRYQTPSRCFFTLLLVYLVCHAGIRALLPWSLEYDEAEQLVHVQTLTWGYSAQPPLYTWILWPVVQLLGPNVYSLLLVKFLLLGVFYLLLHHLAKAFGLDGWSAVAVAFSPLLLPIFGWEAVRMMTHTILMCILCLLTVLVLLRLHQRSSTKNYLFLGVCVGLGGLAKYNFAIFALCLFLASLLLPSLRNRLLDRRIILSIAVAAILVAPHAWWLVENRGEVDAYIRFQARAVGEASQIALLYQLPKMIGQQLLSVLPLILALALCLRQSNKEGDKGVVSFPLVFLRAFAVVSLVVIPLVMMSSGLRHLRIHWLAPWLLFIPMGWIASLNLERLPVWRWQLYFGAQTVMTAAIFIARATTLGMGPEPGMCQTRDLLHAQLAHHLVAIKQAPQVILTPDPVQGGYQRLYFPRASIHCLGYGPAKLPLESQQRKTVVLWSATEEGWRAGWIEELRALSPPIHIRHLECPPGIPPRGSVRRLDWMILSRPSLTTASVK